MMLTKWSAWLLLLCFVSDVYLGLGPKITIAYKCYLEALCIQPTFGISYSNLAGLFMESGDLSRAHQYYKAFGMAAEAIVCYRRTLQSKPDYAMAYGNLASVYDEQGNLDIATVNFNGETYESPNYCTTLRQAEHSAAEVALNALASRGPSNSLAARILDETGVYKNLLQEVSQRVGASLPTYTTFRSGLGHLPIFTCTVELAGCTFTGEPAKNKKQAEKNAAMSAWSSLKLLTQQTESSSLQKGILEEQEHVVVARALQKFRLKARMSNIPFPIPFPSPNPKPHTAQSTPSTTSKILPLICPKTTPRNRSHVATSLDNEGTSNKTNPPPQKQFKITSTNETVTTNRPHKFPAVGAAPYIPVGHFRAHHGIAPPVTIRNAIPVFAAPPLPIPHMGIAPPQFRSMPPTMCSVAPPVTIRQAVPVYSAPNIVKPVIKPSAPTSIPPIDEKGKAVSTAQDSKSLMKPPEVSASAITGLSTPKEEEVKVEEKLNELQI